VSKYLYLERRNLKMKKVLAFLMAVAMLGATAVGCSGGSENKTEEANKATTSNDATTEVTGSAEYSVPDGFFGNEKGATLKVWGPDAYVKLLKKQCDAFVDMYPEQEIKIKVVAQDESSAQTQVANDPTTAADVFGFASDQLANLVNAGHLAEINQQLAANVAASDTEASVDASKVDGKLYAFPETGNGYYMVYDNTVVTEKDAETLEATLAACKKAGKKFVMDCGDGFYGCVFAFTGGAQVDGLDENGKQKFKEYDEDTVVATLKAFSTLMHEYKGTFVSLNPSNISSGFSSGQVGAGVDGSWNATPDKKVLGDKLGACKLPTINVDGEDKQMVSMYGYKMIGVNATSKYPRTSQILAYYLSSQECQQQRADELGWSPTNKAVAESDTVVNDPTIAALVAQGEFGVPQVNIVGSFWTPMGALGDFLVGSDTDPATADFKTQFNKTIESILES
jgi:arabinogalactan oligomer/maltooligosaccharide transport system substrate-binding protein